MKKKVILITTLALMLATAGGALAVPGQSRGASQGRGTGQGRGVGQGSQQHWVDADGDGFCDNFGSGVCGSGNDTGTGWVDADGDDACDVGGGTRPQDGSGMRRGGKRK